MSYKGLLNPYPILASIAHWICWQISVPNACRSFNLLYTLYSALRGRGAVACSMISMHGIPKNVHVCKFTPWPEHRNIPRSRVHTSQALLSISCNRHCACKASSRLGEVSVQPSAQLSDLKLWLSESHGVGQTDIKLDMSAGLYSSTEDFRASQDVQAGGVSLGKYQTPFDP